MRHTILAHRYAVALFELALELNIVDQIGSELGFLEEIISKNLVWEVLLDDAETPLKVKLKMVDEVAESAGLHNYVKDLLKILVERSKFYLCLDIVKSYKEEVLRSAGAVKVVVTVSDKRIEDMVADEVHLVAEKLCEKKPEIEWRTDPEIIGGLKLKIGDIVYDGSIKGELQRIKENLLEKEETLDREVIYGN